MRQETRHNLKISLLLAVVLLICFLLGLLIVKFTAKVNTLDSMLSVSVITGDYSQSLRCWKDNQSGNYYIFLPADAERVLIHAQEGCKVQIDGLKNDTSVSILTMSKPYACRIYENGKSVADENLVFMQSEELPSLFITTPSGSLEYVHANKNNTEHAEFAIWGEDFTSGAVQEFGGRGNTSWDCDKKGYKLEFSNAVSLLGLEEAQKYVLIANARCNYLSNNIAFWLEEQIGMAYVNMSAFVDLYVNGEYLGNYVLCEPVYVGENGIPIFDLEKENFAVNPGITTKDLNTYNSVDGLSKGVLWKNEPDELSGGYLLERDVAEYYAEEESGFVLTSGDHYVIKNPKHASTKQVDYISNYLQESYDAISSADGIHPTTGKHFTEYIDLESFALKYVLEEFLNFNDAGRSSAYYYKDANGMLCAAPGWDFEGAFLKSPEQLTYLNNTPYSTDWYEKLWQHQEFRRMVISLYNEKLVPALDELVDTWMPDMVNLISESAEMDIVRWGREDFKESCNEIATWIQIRVAFLDRMWNSQDEFVTVTIRDDWANKEYIYLKPGDVLTEDLLLQFYAEETAPSFWMTENGDVLNGDLTVFEDMTLIPVHALPARSPVDIALGYVYQILPELVFAIAFCIAVAFYIGKSKQRRKRK